MVAQGASHSAAGKDIGVPVTSVSRWVAGLDRRPSWNLPEHVIITSDVAFFLGLYTAEGSARSNGRCCLSLGNNEHDRVLAEWVVTFLDREWGVQARIWNRAPNRNAIEVYWSHPILAEFLPQICGRGANNKRVPTALWDAERTIKVRFLDGLLAGDGSHSSNGANNLKQSSKDLAWGSRIS